VLLSQAALASSPSAPAYAGKYEGTTDQQMPCRVSVPQGLDGEIKISYRPAQGPWEACSFNPKERSVSRTTVKAAARIDGVVCKVRLNLGKDGKPDTADLMTGGILGLGYDVTCRDLKQAQE
jgi:hypothetical protein